METKQEAKEISIEGATFCVTSIVPDNINLQDILLRAAVEEAIRPLTFAY